MTRSVTWDPDGAGPAASVLVLVGEILAAGPAAQAGVVAWDGSQWLALGTPPSPRAWCATTYNGALVVAFGIAGGTKLSAWNGSVWQTIGTFTGSAVEAVAVHQGSLYVGGTFQSVDGVAAANIACWNGSTWSAVGAGLTNRVAAMVTFSGVLYVASHTAAVTGQLATWNGSLWTTVATCNGPIATLAVRIGTSLPASFLFAGGSFTQWTSSSGTIAATNVVRFNATTTPGWVGLGSNFTGVCRNIFVRSFGISSYEVVAVQGYSNEGLWQWNGTTWVQLGASLFDPYAVSYFGGLYHVSGSYAPAAQRLQAGVWVPLTMATTALGRVQAVADAGSQVVVGGPFGVRRGNPGAWAAVGTGLSGDVLAVAHLANGHLVVSGHLAIGGGSSSYQIARWDGFSWSSIATGMNGHATELLALPDGDLVVGGEFTTIGGIVAAYVARWDGALWHALSGGMNAPVRGLARMANGDLVAGGDFTLAGSLIGTALYVARWNGVAWSAIGVGMDGPVTAIAVSSSGEVFAATTVPYYVAGTASHARRWNGSLWSTAPVSLVANAMLALPDGDVLFACDGPFGSSPGLVRLTGTTAVDQSVHGNALALAAAGNGDVLVGGDFDTVGSMGSVGFARLAATCPATATVSGTGCPSSGGSNTLAAATLPWVDATFRATGTGLPNLAIVVALTSVTSVPQGAVPLASVFAQGIPGCDLLVAPDILEAMVTMNGTAVSQLYLPNTPPLVGVAFYHQMVPIELDGLGNWVAITATNALQLVAGTF